MARHSKGVIEDYTIIDVRTKQEFQLGAIPNAINIPVDEMRQRINEVPKDKPICIYCLVGLRGYLAQQILIGNGFENVYNLSGGYKIYKTIISLSHEINKENENTKPQYSSKPVMEKISKNTIKVDACGLQCRVYFKIKNKIDEIKEGDVIK